MSDTLHPIAQRIKNAGIPRPGNWDEMGSSEKDLWEDSIIEYLDKIEAEKLPTATPPYAEGTILLSSDGLAYRARQVYPAVGEEQPRQRFSVLDLDGAVGVISADDLPEELHVIWQPKQIDSL